MPLSICWANGQQLRPYAQKDPLNRIHFNELFYIQINWKFLIPKFIKCPHLFSNWKSTSQRQNQWKDFGHKSAKSQIIGQFEAIHDYFHLGNAGTYVIVLLQ